MSETDFNQSVKGTISLNKIRMLAFELHQGQKDHSGQDYILHPERVANNVIRMFPKANEHVIMAAWLHDTIEDCIVNGEPVNANFLKRQNVPEEVITMVEFLTKPENDEREYDQVIRDLIETGNAGAIMVKISDNADNLHPTRVQELFASEMEQNNPGKAQRLNQRYIASVKQLSEAININPDVIFTAIKQSPPLKIKFNL